MDFITSYMPTKRWQQPQCDGYEDIYERQFDASGVATFVKTGRRYIPDEIRSYQEDCDINFIIRRCLKEGSLDDLKARPGFIDLSHLPENFLDLWNMSERLRGEFGKLSAEERNAFNNSDVAYIDARFNGLADTIIEKYKSTLPSDGKSEVKDE